MKNEGTRNNNYKRKMFVTIWESKENNVGEVIHCSFLFVKFLEFSTSYNLIEK